jgi:hypothetical protein
MNFSFIEQRTKRRELQMGSLSSGDLKEREEVLVSTIMIAQILNNRWSELLTPNFRVTKDLAGPGSKIFLAK